jgi:hypothetical protein
MESVIDVVEFEFPRKRTREFRRELEKILRHTHISLSFVARYRFTGDHAIAEVPLSAVSRFSDKQIQRLKNIKA